MKIKNKKIKKRLLIISVSSAVAVVLLVIVFIYASGRSGPGDATNDNETTGTNTTKASSQAETSTSTIKEKSTQGSSKSTDTTSAADSVVSVAITRKKVEDNKLNIGVFIDRLTGEGTCTLTLSKGSNVVTKSSGVQALSSYSTCAGFSVSTDELSPGDWLIKVDFRSGTAHGSTSTSVTI